ncbi:hypothetical protein TRIUR3_09704 [Triticum urartu]|uniref:Non-haem dioxygenase N-terminal domain-containing protein n=1 Tax=Triticum urartu TaxID=4572 RepID=M7ZK21_TRIUA|nr:hypothetical protein TRIUR3_09704 [Triticum urartu]
MVHQAQDLLVQEVAADGELPSRYVLKEQQGRPAAATERAALSIPTVDVSRLASADPSEADKLRSALGSWGLFAVTGHGMTDPFLDAILGAARGFFHLPTEAKQEYSNVVDADDGGRKFQPEGYGVDRVDTDEQVLDWCDRLYLQIRPDDARQLRFWPTHPPDLAELLKEFSVEGEKVAKLVVTAMARCLGFEDGFFVDKDYCCVLYPACASLSYRRTWTSVPSTLRIRMQSSHGVEDRSRRSCSHPRTPGSVYVFSVSNKQPNKLPRRMQCRKNHMHRSLFGPGDCVELRARVARS